MQNTNEPTSVTIGEEAVAGLHREWVFGWERPSRYRLLFSDPT